PPLRAVVLLDSGLNELTYLRGDAESPHTALGIQEIEEHPHSHVVDAGTLQMLLQLYLLHLRDMPPDYLYMAESRVWKKPSGKLLAKPLWQQVRNQVAYNRLPSSIGRRFVRPNLQVVR